ncbi:DUF6633 family protein [Xylanibacter ruminicola]|nr:DUF6633 family protein [Xylanibacter ruminicola]
MQKSDEVSTITTALMSQEELKYVAKYRKKYGSLDGVVKMLSFSDIMLVTSDPCTPLTADVPSFALLNKTFGENASVKWLYVHLKNLFVRLLVDEKRISNSQIDFLAGIIVSNYPGMKLTEFMLFESSFLSGKYGVFYGETSYILSITSSLRQFWKDLIILYQQIERKQEDGRKSEQDEYQQRLKSRWKDCCADLIAACPDKKGKEMFSHLGPAFYNEEQCELMLYVTREESMALEGDYFELFSTILLRHYPKVYLRYRLYDRITLLGKGITSQREIETAKKSAIRIIENPMGWPKDIIGNAEYCFRRRYGKTPEDYLSEFSRTSEFLGKQNI